MKTDEKIKKLRALMAEHKIDAYVIPSADAHQSEYVCGYWQSREYISGFTGSAGTAVITQDFAGLWTDGRYFIQAARQIKGTEFTLFKHGLEGVLNFNQWLAKKLPEKSVIGFDGRTVSLNSYKDIKQLTDRKNIEFKTDVDLIGQIWEDRPPLPAGEAYLHETRFAGKSHDEKLDDVRKAMDGEGASAYLISSLDDIAWLYNMRGSDISFTPVVYAYSFITMDREILFINRDKLTRPLLESLNNCNVDIKEYDDILPFIKAYEAKGSIYLNLQRVSVALKAAFTSGCAFIEKTDITTNLKARKNDIEIKNIDNSQLKDGVAMAQFLSWLSRHLKTNTLYEYDIIEILRSFRSKQEHFVGESFGTIAAYMANAAQMHYSPPKTGSAEIKPEGFLLIDSGGQYLDGTTDITRTLVLGSISDEMKKDFTLVLKSHIGLARAKWLYGSTGSNLDILARKPMWDHGMDYKCGTGHGLGYFLNVHEGPQGFRQASSEVVLEPGMLTTNEPGVYKEGQWGIRTENTLLVEDDLTTDCGRFLKFRTVSYCPISISGIEKTMLNSEELNWLNSYHSMVYEKISPFLNDEDKNWLRENTMAI